MEEVAHPISLGTFSKSVSALENMSKLLEHAREGHVFSAYQLYGECKGKVIDLTGGVTSYWPGGQSTDSTTLFDIGSLTKVVFTTTLIARAMAKGEIRLDEGLSEKVPEWRGCYLEELTIADLLSHSSGMVDWIAIHEEGERDLISYLRKQDLRVCKTRTQSVYSDINFLLLGVILERLFGPVRDTFEREVRRPLGLSSAQFGPLALGKNIAATEYRETLGQPLQGIVFDENCHFLGGATAHAGIFSTAAGLGPLSREWLRAVSGQSDFLPQSIAKRFTSRTNVVAGSSWALGWDTKSQVRSSCGDYFSHTSFGHLGYTGCSLWIDPQFEAYLIFLTNRAHPSRLDERIKRVRPLVHNAAMEFWRSGE